MVVTAGGSGGGDGNSNKSATAANIANMLSFSVARKELNIGERFNQEIVPWSLNVLISTVLHSQDGLRILHRYMQCNRPDKTPNL